MAGGWCFATALSLSLSLSLSFSLFVCACRRVSLSARKYLLCILFYLFIFFFFFVCLKRASIAKGSLVSASSYQSQALLAAKREAEAKKIEAESSEWECPGCGYENNSTKRCKMCNVFVLKKEKKKYRQTIFSSNSPFSLSFSPPPK